MSAAVEQQFSVTAPDCQYRISARQATAARTGKIPPVVFSVFSAALFQGLLIQQEGAAACDPSGEAAQPQLFTPLHIPCSTIFLPFPSVPNPDVLPGFSAALGVLASSAGHLQPTHSHIPVE